ncbi:hypothetical protein PO909_003805 [Leuciscus waleckii]
MLFLDFYKAFDSIEHGFIFKTLEKFGFGNLFIRAVKTLYVNGNSSIKLKHGTSPRFELQRGIRQGCPISPYLFILTTQLLANHIKNSALQGVGIMGKEIIISQLADDTTLFLKNSDQIPLALDAIKTFSDASGLHLNVLKCELMPIKELSVSSICNIQVKETITYLGIVISKNSKLRCNLNFLPIIEKAKKRFNQWLQRDLSLKGRILLSKAEGISRLTYAAISLDLDRVICKRIDQLLCNFVWKNKTHYIKKSVLSNSFSNGGLNFVDFATLNNTFKINWLRNYLRNPFSIWNIIPEYVFSQLGGLSFLLMCNFSIEKIPVALCNFHKQALLAWSMIFKHNFSPTNYFIWNNKNICYKHKSLFFENWFKNGINRVSQLFNQDGYLFTYQEFLSHYNTPVTPKQFATVFGAIPNGVIMLFKGHNSFLTSSEIPLPDPTDTYIGRICFKSTLKNNRGIRLLFLNDSVSTSHVVTKWNALVENISWKKVWTLPNKYLLVNKVKEISFKLIHRYYPVKTFMVSTFKLSIDVNCTFCDSQPETILHLFWHCDHTRKLWQDICQFIVNYIYKDFEIYFKDVLFGFFIFEMCKMCKMCKV